jgi:hypothetical protein
MSTQNLLQSLQVYCKQHERFLRNPLGSGVHGRVFVAERKDKTSVALKVHSELEPYERERDVYCRLRDLEVSEINGFTIPQLINASDDLQIIEMTIVSPPYLLDFAGAYLDHPPDFPDDVWIHWREQKKEEFGVRFPEMENVLATLRRWDIFLLDIHPRNLTFE